MVAYCAGQPDVECVDASFTKERLREAQEALRPERMRVDQLRAVRNLKSTGSIGPELSRLTGNPYYSIKVGPDSGSTL